MCPSARITPLALFFALVFLSLKLSAQDVITLKNGDEVQVKVTEVTASEIKYKRFDNLDGPLYTVPKTDVFMIKYENGTKDVFEDRTGQWMTVPEKKKRVPKDDPAAWNYDIINFMENPALAGEDAQHNITGDFSSDPSEDDSKVGYDFLLKPFKKPITLGLGAYYSHRGIDFGSSAKHTFGIAGSFKYALKNNASLSAGLSLGIVNYHSIGYASYNFFNAYFTGVSYYPIVEEGWYSNISESAFTRFGAMNVGAWYRAKNYFAGISFNNITRYNESVYDGERSPSPVYFSAAAGYHLNLGGKATLTPSVVYRTQNFRFHRVDPRLTVSFSKSRFLLGTYYQNRSLYGLFGADICTYVQVVWSMGGSVSRKGEVDTVYTAVSLRVHFLTRKNKTASEKL